MIEVRVTREPSGVYRAAWGNFMQGGGWVVGRNAEEAHTRLCDLGAKIVCGDGALGVYLIRSERIPGYGDNE